MLKEILNLPTFQRILACDFELPCTLSGKIMVKGGFQMPLCVFSVSKYGVLDLFLWHIARYHLWIVELAIVTINYCTRLKPTTTKNRNKPDDCQLSWPFTWNILKMRFPDLK